MILAVSMQAKGQSHGTRIKICTSFLHADLAILCNIQYRSRLAANVRLKKNLIKDEDMFLSDDLAMRAVPMMMSVS